MQATQNRTDSMAYGCDAFGRLTQALLHRPNGALGLINSDNHRKWLFDAVPDQARFIEEHDRYREMLIAHGVNVIELSDHVSESRPLMDRMPNLVYLHDIAVISRKGAILSTMAWEGRKGEEIVLREAFASLGIPILHEFTDPEDAFEGCLLLSPDTVLVAHTERHRRASIEKFIRKAVATFQEVILVDIPKARRYMHPDTIYNRAHHHLAVAYLPAFKSTTLHTVSGVERIDFVEHMRKKGVEIVNVTDSEQRRLACSFVPLEPGVIFQYDTAFDRETRSTLARKGVEVIPFHPDAMKAGGGSLRCITLRLRRRPAS